MEGACRTKVFDKSWFRFLNPLRWSKRAIRVFVAGFFLIMLPIYLYIGLQPTNNTEALSYPTLEIPSIALSTPVANLKLEDHQLIAPATIAGAYVSHEHKTFVIGHASTVFKNLNQVKLDDIFSYAGQSYQIVEIETLAKNEIDMKEILAPASSGTIIMMTCAGEPLPNQDATHRLIITAIAIEN